MVRCLVLFVVLLGVIEYSTGFVPGYQIVEGSLQQDSTGIQAELIILPESGSPYGSDFASLNLTISFVTNAIVRVQIYPVDDPTRWRVPESILNGPYAKATTTDVNLFYSVQIENDPFSLSIVRKSNGEIIFNSTQTSDPTFNGLIFSDQYIEWSTQVVNTPYIYGLGERVDSFLLDASSDSAPYEMWNRDQGFAREKRNLYGTHPMYVRMNEETSQAHGVLLFNSNAMNVALKPDRITWTTIGGIIDMFFFVPNSSNPESVVQAYTSIVGRPFLPSYFTLGRHQCRWGYRNIEETQQVVESYALHQIPLDTMWNDIDYMNEYLDFTTDPIRFPLNEVAAFTDYLHQNDQHYFIIVDPGIAVQSGYPPYDQGMNQSIFINNWNQIEPIQGKVWPGVTVFPDFLNPNASQYWYEQISTFYKSGVSFDGLWADMSEPSSFCSGACGNMTTPAYPPNDVYDNPPFNPITAPLNQSTISMSAQTVLGPEYNAHDLFGYSETVATYNALKTLLQVRPFVMPRSTFIGSGFYAAHWLGDNLSTWDYLKSSISGILSMQLFGIPMAGADICGFNSETTDELCSRWEQLGAFYPMSRNHNAIKMRSQEPYALSQEHLEITKDAIRLRYLLLPYFYTLMFRAHADGNTVWKPLFFLYPNDVNTYAIDEQFLVGDSILVTPVLQSNQTSVKGYFPADVWYDFYSGEKITSVGSWMTLDAPMDKIPVHLRGGTIIPTQIPGLTTAASRKNPFELLVQLADNSCSASGQLVLDDGISLHTLESGEYSVIVFQSNSVNSTSCELSTEILLSKYSPASPAYLGGLRICGVASKPKSVTVNKFAITTFVYNHNIGCLHITGILAPLLSPISIVW